MDFIEKENKLIDLEYNILNKTGVCINVGHDYYTELIENEKEYFYIDRNSDVVFSPEQAIEILNCLNKKGKQQVRLTEGVFTKLDNKYIFDLNGYIDEFDDEQMNIIKDWLKEVLLIGGYEIMDYENNTKLKELKLSGIFLDGCYSELGICINVNVNFYKKLKENYSDYFYIGDKLGKIVFSPKQALEIIDNIENEVCNSVEIKNGEFKNGSNSSYFSGYDIFTLTKEQTIQLKDWLKEILIIGGYIKSNNTELSNDIIKYDIKGNTISATYNNNICKATCNTEIDTFDEKKGKLIATARVLGFDKETINKIIDVLFDEYYEFDNRIQGAIDLLTPIVNRRYK